MMKMTTSMIQVWLLTLVVSFFLAFGLGAITVASFESLSGLGIPIGLAIFALFWLVTMIKAYFETPYSYVDIVERFGKYIGRPLEPGPHILYPYFNLEVIRARVFMRQQKLDLKLSNVTDASGDVEFKDCSSSIDASFFFSIVNPEASVYGINDLFGSLREKTGHMLRSFFGMYTLDEAISLKSFFKIENVACMLDISETSPGEAKHYEDFRKYAVTDAEFEATKFYQIISSWGVKPVAIIVADIDVPEEIKKQRSRKLTAEKDKEVAEIEIGTAENKSRRMAIDAEADADKMAKLGEGQAKALRQVVDNSGLPKEKVSDYLIQTKKWEALGNNANVTIIEGSDTASEGVKLGVGISAGTKKELKKN